MKKLILLLSVIFSVSLFGGTDGTIRGKVADMSGQPLVGVMVYIPEIELGTVTGVDGNYRIMNVLVGTYSVEFRMIGYQDVTVNNVQVAMDQTLWLNQSLKVSLIEGDEITVTKPKIMVKKGDYAKKVTIGEDEIESLPVRDISELYTLQSGVVKVESRTQGVPDHEERGLEEVHVRGGRSGEIAYMIDGLYIRNPIFGGIGSGTRLNLFAVKEFDWQPGGFNAEYGDAMSAVSNMHTQFGIDEYVYKLKYETSMVGEALGSDYDELRGYNDYSFGIGGPTPFFNKLKFWVSGQYTDNENYSVYKFDDIIYNTEDPYDPQNAENIVQPWDTEAGLRGFGFQKTWDVFGKLSYNVTQKIRLNSTIWRVANHRKIFNTRYLYWDEGQNELFRDTERYTFEVNHSVTENIFYNLRLSRFVQDQFQGVRWNDSDGDGFPNWFEWRHSAGANRTISDPYNPYMVPYVMSENGDTIRYIKKDDRSGWYHGATPGIYNWAAAEDFIDNNHNAVYDEGEFLFDENGDGVWDGPELVEKCYYRDGSYWLMPEMYEDYGNHEDFEAIYNELSTDPYLYNFGGTTPVYPSFPGDPRYYLPTWEGYTWSEGSVFGGHDRFFGESTAITNEFRLDVTAQLTDKWKIRSGVDYKTHKLNFYEVLEPWLDDAAQIQSFAEFWNDCGLDGLCPGDPNYEDSDSGENNGKWDPGESFDDANGDGEWNDFREPREISLYFQNTFEVPWMVINAGIRADGVNYQTDIWSDPNGDPSPTLPWYFADIGQDGEAQTGDVGENDDVWNYDEPFDDNPGFAQQKVMFTEAQWFWKYSPRLGFSHVITDQATFTFSYGVYHQTPIYQNVYLNTNRLEDPQELFEEGTGLLGNATMSASRTQAYEFGFNVQVGRFWAFSLLGWVKDMDQLITTKTNRSGIYEYKVFSNGDYGNAKGIDFTLQNKNMPIIMMLQYTYSIAKANSEYDWAAVSSLMVDAPSQEFLMPYDRPHDMSLTLFTPLLPFGLNASLTGFFQSGYPYTPMKWNGNTPETDIENKNTKRSPNYRNLNLSLSKYIDLNDYKVTLGLNVFNLTDMENARDVYRLTGKADDPGEYYTDSVGLPDADHDKSGSYYDNPWYFQSPREINFFVKFEFN